jgi:hypothetical protein
MAEVITPVAETTVRVYNRSARTFMHGAFSAVPRAFATVSASVAKLWMERYPDDIVEAGVAQKELNGAQVELGEVKAQLKAANARIAELEAQIAGGKPGKKTSVLDVV